MAFRAIRTIAPTASRQLAVSRRTFAAGPAIKSAGSQYSSLTTGALCATVLAASLTLTADPAHAAAPKVDPAAVKAAIMATIEAEDERRGDGTSLAPTLVRLAWHASGTYSKADGSGGSNGCRMRFNPEAGWGANAGLATARNFLDPLKAKFPGLSYADLYTYAGAVAIEYVGGPAIPFAFGRTDATDGTTSPPDGRLPNADMGSPAATAQHLRDIFYRMGFDDREIVALSGAHALGRCHEDASGYWGPWTRAESTLSNEYFRLLKEEPWTPKAKKHESGGCPWKGPAQYESADGSLMMLPSDLALVQDPKFHEWVLKYKDDEELFFKDFAAAFGKLLALGVKESTAGSTGGAGGGLGGLLAKLMGFMGL